MTSAREATVFLAALAIGFVITAAQFAQCIAQGQCPLGGDFDVFHRAAEQAANGHAQDVYDLGEARRWQSAPPDAIVSVQPFLYPPSSLLPLYPLGFFHRTGALILCYAAQIALLLAALRTAYARHWLGAAVLLPACAFGLYSFVAGQMGIGFAALFLLTLALRGRHPVLSGCAMAGFCLKPQLGIALALLLLKEKNTKALAAAAIVALSAAGASMLLWGTDLWAHYARMLALYRGVVAAAPPHYTVPSASPYLAMRLLGLGNEPAMVLQAALAAAALIALWRAPQAGADEGRVLLRLATATFLISPYAFLYDTVMLAFPCAALIHGWKDGRSDMPERIALVLLAFIPLVALKIQIAGIPYAFAAIAFSFAVSLRRAHDPRQPSFR